MVQRSAYSYKCRYFLICEFTGDWLYDEGQFSVLYLTHSREYYRLVTSMFLHADIGHLVNNMILLYFGGEIVEKTIGSFRYLALFLYLESAEIFCQLYMS